MSEAVVAKRYADALFQLGNDKASLDQLVENIKVVGEVFTTNKQLNTFLSHPRVSNAKKRQFLDVVFQGIDKDIVNTIKLLVERHRVGLTSAIIDHFIQLVNDAKGIAEGTVYSVRELKDNELHELETTFAKRFAKKTVILENVVDPSLIGGIKIRMGNTVFDGSIRGKLHRIERKIVSANK